MIDDITQKAQLNTNMDMVPLILLLVSVAVPTLAGNNNEDTDSGFSRSTPTRATDPYYAYINPRVKPLINSVNLYARQVQAFRNQNIKMATRTVPVNVIRRQYQQTRPITREFTVVKSVPKVPAPAPKPVMYRIVVPASTKPDDYKEKFMKPIIYTNPITGGKTIVGGYPLLKTHLKTELVKMKPLPPTNLLNNQKQIMYDERQRYQQIATTPVPPRLPQSASTRQIQTNSQQTYIQQPHPASTQVNQIPSTVNTYQIQPQPIPSPTAKPQVRTMNTASILTNQLLPVQSSGTINSNSIQSVNGKQYFYNPNTQVQHVLQQNPVGSVMSNPVAAPIDPSRTATSAVAANQPTVLTSNPQPTNTAQTGPVADPNSQLGQAAGFITAFFGQLQKHFSPKDPYQVATTNGHY